MTKIRTKRYIYQASDIEIVRADEEEEQSTKFAPTDTSTMHDVAAEYVKAAELLAAVLETKGGPGSGNWGHRGRPGSRGGSAPGGGSGMGKEALFSSHSKEEIKRIKVDGINKLVNETGVSHDEATAIQKAWARESSNGGSYQDGLQLIAQDKYGGISTPGIDVLRSPYSSGYAINDQVKQFIKSGDGEKVFSSIQQRTQDYFKSKGLKPDDEITVYRGLKFEQKPQNINVAGDAVNINSRPLSSWSLSYNTAHNFSKDIDNGRPHGIVLEAQVKVRDVFSHYSTGFGCAKEAEVVLTAQAVSTANVLEYHYYGD